MSRNLLVEFLGTFTLVLAGTGAIVIDAESNHAIGHAGIALTFGLAVASIIYTYAGIFDCNINPAVTISLASIRKIPIQRAVSYVVAQVLGAVLASLILHLCFPTNQSLGATLPVGSPMRSWVLEFLLTAILMLTVMRFVNLKGEAHPFAGIAIGGVVALEAMFAGPICGASMNPARSLGPAIVSGQTQFLWIYLSAPILGAIAAAYLGQILFVPQEEQAIDPSR